MTWLGMSEVDCSASLSSEQLARIPRGGFETEMTWLGMTEFGCSPESQCKTINGNGTAGHDEPQRELHGTTSDEQ